MKMIASCLTGARRPDLVINNTVISTVRLVGRFTDQIITEDKASFMFNDGTGRMRGSIWLGEDPALTNQFSAIQVGGYGTFIGRVSFKFVTPELTAYSCRKINDFNEITHHFLSVIRMHINLVRVEEPNQRVDVPSPQPDDTIPKDALVPSPQPVPIAMAATSSTVILHQDAVPAFPIGCTGSTLPPSIGTPISRAVVDTMRRLSESATSVGTHIDEISGLLMTTTDVIRPFLMDLASIAEVYMTVDADHFRET